jgi:hypothetical protein
MDWMAAFTWTEWQPSDGLGGRNPWNTQLDAFKSEQQPLELIFPCENPLDPHA